VRSKLELAFHLGNALVVSTLEHENETQVEVQIGDQRIGIDDERLPELVFCFRKLRRVLFGERLQRQALDAMRPSQQSFVSLCQIDGALSASDRILVGLHPLHGSSDGQKTFGGATSSQLICTLESLQGLEILAAL
jgi:hypothetical protein